MARINTRGLKQISPDLIKIVLHQMWAIWERYTNMGEKHQLFQGQNIC